MSPKIYLIWAFFLKLCKSPSTSNVKARAKIVQPFQVLTQIAHKYYQARMNGFRRNVCPNNLLIRTVDTDICVYSWQLSVYSIETHCSWSLVLRWYMFEWRFSRSSHTSLLVDGSCSTCRSHDHCTAHFFEHSCQLYAYRLYRVQAHYTHTELSEVTRLFRIQLSEERRRTMCGRYGE